MENNSLFDFQSLKNKWVAERILERHVLARTEERAEISSLDFTGETLIGLNLDGATLFYPDGGYYYDEEHATTLFGKCDLRFATLCGCDARYASFKEANLTFVRFGGSDLRGADFTGATLACADFSHVKSCERTQFTLSPQLLSCDFTGVDMGKARVSATVNGRRRNIPVTVGDDGRLALDLGAETGPDAGWKAAAATEYAAMRAQSDFLISAFAQHVRAAQAKGELPGGRPALAGFIARLEKSVKAAAPEQARAKPGKAPRPE
jgi:hypothetical protein